MQTRRRREFPRPNRIASICNISPDKDSESADKRTHTFPGTVRGENASRFQPQTTWFVEWNRGLLMVGLN